MKQSRNARPIKLLVLTSLYPNSVQQTHGVFVEERLRSLMAGGAVEAKVVAPVPWFPSSNPRFGRYAIFAKVPKKEVRHGVEVVHPRYPVVPRVGMTLGPSSMAIAIESTLRAIRRDGYDFDVIDAHYFYPDGAAAAMLGKRFGRPVVITARGSDINHIAEFAIPRFQIRKAAERAAAVVTVSRALKSTLVKLGVDAAKIVPLRNGVDLKRFVPVERDKARAELGVQGPVWLSVGRLVEGKGVHIAIEALRHVTDAMLFIIGTGPDEAALRAQAEQMQVSDRVRFVGAVSHGKLSRYYTAADALVLAARSEGMPNVVLESIACGTAVIATAVGGIPELIQEPVSGALMQDRSPEAIASAWKRLVDDGIGAERREDRRRFAQRFSWDETTLGQLEIFRRLTYRSESPQLAGEDSRQSR